MREHRIQSIRTMASAALRRVALFAAIAAGLWGGILTLGEAADGGRHICHDGWLLLHKASGFSANTNPIDWHYDDLVAARDTFLGCNRAALRTGNMYLRVEAVLGWNEAERSLAQHVHFFSLGVRVYSTKAPEKDFHLLHSAALGYARTALDAIDKFGSEIATTSGTTDEWSIVDKAKRIDAEIKEKILRTSFDSIPRNRAEYTAMLATPAGNFWSIRQMTGLTEEERCTEKPQTAAVKEFATVDVDVEQSPKPGAGQATWIKANINPDGSLYAAHIVRSSGSEVHDTQAMSRLYQTTFVPARRKCKNVAGSVVLEY